MVLVQAYPVEAEFVGVLHFVKITVVKLGPEFGVVVAVGEGDPRRSVLFDRIEVDMAVGHQVEVEELHGSGPSLLSDLMTIRTGR